MSSPVEVPAPIDVDPAEEAFRPPPPTPLRDVSRIVAAPTAALFGTLSRLRGKRAMHPVGVVRSARLSVPDEPGLPPAWRALDGATGVIRLSKSAGTPRRVPDVLGMALRFGEQDLLLASALRPVGFQHLLVPASGFAGTAFSSLLPLHMGRRTAVVQAWIPHPLPAAADALEAVALASGLEVSLAAVGLLGGRQPLGIVDIGRVERSAEAAAVRFDPWRCGGGLVPAGPLQRWRAPAYAASRAATRR